MKMLCAYSGFLLGDRAGMREKCRMCCRYLLLDRHLDKVLLQLGVARSVETKSRYNIAPGTKVPVVRRCTIGSGEGRELAALRWGLVPAWTKGGESGAGLPNARAETLGDKPSFREAFKVRRCVVPASGFYEWRRQGRSRQPWLFQLSDGQPFLLAGVWEVWRGTGAGDLETCAVVTTGPNQIMQPIHDRLPVILPVASAGEWMNPETSPSRLAELMAPFPAGAMQARPLSGYVNSTANDDEGCLAPAGPGTICDQMDFGL